MHFTPIDYAETDEHRMIQQTARKFLAEKLAPIASQIDQEERFAIEVFKGLGELGLLALIAPEEHGGGGHDVIGTAIVAEEISKICAGTYTSVQGHVFCTHWIDKYATPEQKKRYLPKLASTEWIGGIAITEADAGSDVASLKTKAVRQGDHYVLNGSKTFITNGSVASVIVCLTRTGGPGPKGISTFIVETASPGFSASKPFEKCGNRASPTCEITFEDCRVPAANLLGKENNGFIESMVFFPFERALVAVCCGALCESALMQAVSYCKDRKQFSKPIIEFQMVQQMLAEMAVDLHITKTLTRDTLRKYASGSDANVDASIAKIFAADAAMRVTSHAVQLLGGYGYTREFPVERWFRDARLFSIGGGTSQIQKLIVARALM